MLNSPPNYIDPTGYFEWSFDYFFGGFTDWGSSFFQGSYQSRLDTAQMNNSFVSNTLFGANCFWCGSPQIEMTKYAMPVFEWDGMISGPHGKYSIWDGTKYEAGLGSPWFGNPDDFIPQKLPLKGISLAGSGILPGLGKIGSEAVKATKAGKGVASVDELIKMMNKRPNVTADYATGDNARYMKALNIEGKHLALESGLSEILLRKDVATRRTAFHEWLHRRLQLQNGQIIPGEDAIIERFLSRHERLFRLND